MSVRTIIASLLQAARPAGAWLAAATLTTAAVAQTPDWRALARQDLDGAHVAIATNHPGMAAELGDTAFIAAESRGYETAHALIDRVETAGGYRAVLTAYAASFADPHIAVRFSSGPPILRWPGFRVARRGGQTVVAASQAPDVAVGDVILRCDGVGIDALAQASLGRFDTDWSVEAERIARTPLLFLDQGNPFITYPHRCVFRRGAQERTGELKWVAIEPAAWNAAAPRPQRRFDVRTLTGGGVWISLPQLNGAGAAFVASLATRAEEFRAAPFVVVDVRGNGGGNSGIGDRLAEVLAVPRLQQSPGSQHWRASEGNAAAVAAYVRMPQFSEVERAVYKAQATQISEAVRSGAAFFPPLPAVRPVYAPTATPDVSPRTARFLILTDHVCASSCLSMVERFRAGGAAQVGADTSFSTRYQEVRGVVLPSGLATINVLQKVSLARSDRFGPFAPAASFPGDLDDDAAVERWVMALRE